MTENMAARIDDIIKMLDCDTCVFKAYGDVYLNGNYTSEQLRAIANIMDEKGKEAPNAD